MKCPFCAQETDHDAMFCTVCGRKIPRCPTCGTVIYQKSAFCELDGTPLPLDLFVGFPSEQAASSAVETAPPVLPVVRAAPPVPPVVEAAASVPPAAEAAQVGSPAGGPMLTPPVLPKKKMGKGPLIAIIVVVILLLAAAVGYFFLRDELASYFGKGDEDAPASSENREWDEADDEPEDDPVEVALGRAKDYADSGRYEKALREVEGALEEHPRSKELQEARLEYIAAFEADALERADALAESEGFPAAVQSIREALETLGEESEQLSGREREYEALYVADILTQAEHLAGEQRVDEAKAMLDEAAALFPENGDIYEKIQQLEAKSESIGSTVSSFSMEAVTSVTATSYLSQSNLGLYHTADRTIDGDLSTAWVEGADGDGIGESITFTFDNAYLVSGMQIYAGYQKSADLYSKNARPAILTVRFSDGSEQMVTLQDVNGLQEIAFDGPVETSSITLIIASAYPGSKYEDTVISELSFY